MDTRRMDSKRTMTMNWDGLGFHDDDDDDDFFEANNRMSCLVPFDMLMAHHSDDSSEEEFEDPRMSFASVMSSSSLVGGTRTSNVAGPTPPLPQPSTEEYDIWMAAPTSIQERRRRLLQGMGLNSSKELLRLTTMAMSKKLLASSTGGAPPLPLSGGSKGGEQENKNKEFSHTVSTTNSKDQDGDQIADHLTESYSLDVAAEFLIRSRSDGDIDPFSVDTKRRKENLIGDVSKQRLTRTLSTLSPYTRLCKMTFDNSNNSSRTTAPDSNNQKEQSKDNQKTKKRITKNGKNARSKQQNNTMVMTGGDQIGAFFLIKNLDTGNEFVVKEFAEDGMWNRLRDLQTGRQLTMEEFEKSVGYSPVVKELMSREHGRPHSSVDGNSALERKNSVNALLYKSFRNSKRRGVSLLKNINKVASSVTSIGGSIPEKEQPQLPPIPTATPNSDPNPEPPKGGKGGVTPENNEWVRVRTQGKTYKELTALRFCQEIQAHQGSIWTIKFNFDGRYLASAGEDKVIHIWEVQECEVASFKAPEECANSSPLHPMFCPSPDRGDKSPLAPDMSTLEKKKKGRSGSRRGSSMPDYVQLPETVFTLSNEPVCSFQGHLDDVLDLSWSRTQLYLLSSSMDKTVRLWDLETKACLRIFVHNDYVTCIQFNPVNDEYFISGSLDAKVRIWSVPGRRVVDWTDLHEMVTAACYTPDGQGAAVGSHKGNCRMYSITDGKMSQTVQFDIQTKKKSTPKKITGFEFTPGNPNEVLITSADSRVRIYDGSEVLQKFRGFRNTSSQISASYSPDGQYVVCGSEDSNVYVWKREEPKNGKTKTIIDTRSYEYFHCKDVSVAIPWPGSIKFSPPTINLQGKKNSKKPPSGISSPRKDEMNKTGKKQLPPLPYNKKNSNHVTEKTVSNDNSATNHANQTSSNNQKDANSSCNNKENNVEEEKAAGSPEADPAEISRTDSGSFNSSNGASIRHGDSPSISSNQSSAQASWAPGWNWFDGGGSQGSETIQAKAWGLVIVTAGLGGEIRAYQNFGIPLKVGQKSFLA